MNIRPTENKEKVAQLAAKYTLEYCEALLRQDPAATLRLFAISQQRPSEKNHKKVLAASVE